MLKGKKYNRPGAEKGLEEGWTRVTFIVEKNVLEKARDYAYWERMHLKDVVNEALIVFFADKDISPRPNKRSSKEEEKSSEEERRKLFDHI